MTRRATDGRYVFVATNGDGRIVGYVDLEADGHIDHLYCLPEAVGQGVASALYDHLEALAEFQGINEIRVEASEAARRFFEKKGFAVTARRDWELRGVPIHNYQMNKSLHPQDPLQLRTR
jgi:putative acetyltransferase